jgi:TolB-like protein/AraC-like DNA-binding protein/Tfp pilus assembly protein PilF
MENQHSMGDQFLRIIHQNIEENLGNEDFSVEDLAKSVGLSRSMLHRKLIKLTGKSAGNLIAEKRLLRAKELLENDVATSSEIAYKVGFKSPSYFTRVFKNYFKVSPGDVRKGVVIIPPHTSDDYLHENRNFTRKRIRNFSLIIPIILFILILTGGGMYYLFEKKIPGDKSIVILPFDNLSSDTENMYFADGIIEDILNNLFLISDLRVISRTTSKRFIGTNLTAKEIAREVNTRNVLEGSIRRYGNKVRISVQLIDARRDQHLWSANFDRDLNDIMGIQGDIALQVAQKLNAVISDKEKHLIGKIPTKNSEAYDNYLKGRFLLHKANSEQRSDFDKEGVMACLQYFEKAIAADKNFAEAYAGLANARFNLSAWGWLPANEGAFKAKDLFAKALEIDPDCAEAHAVKGAFHAWVECRFEEGRKEFETSVQLNPNFATTHQWYAQLLMTTGPIEEARRHMDRAVELEPYFWVVQNLNAWIYYFEGKFDKAIDACFIAHDLKPGFLENNWLFFLNYAKLGEGEKAMKELQTIAGSSQNKNEFADEIKDAYDKSGINGLFSWLIKININKPVPIEGMDGYPFFIAWWNAILGNKEESINWLMRNTETNKSYSTYLILIATNPDFDLLHDDPRFQTIIEKIGLAPYNTRKAKHQTIKL